MTVADLDPEDAKIVTLARAARDRSYAPHRGQREGAAVRDTDGRTYAAATVEHADPALSTSALRAAVVAAVSSGARRFEAVALAADPRPSTLTAADAALLAEFGAVPVLLSDPQGSVQRSAAGPAGA